MQIGVKFPIAVHILLSIEYFKDEKNTSEFLAETVGTNPVIIRKITSCLKSAGLVEVRAGIGGMNLAKSPENISLYDVYMAVSESKKELFKIHSSPHMCPLGGRIDALLRPHFLNAQNALKAELQYINIQNLLSELA
ncbi:Rrf2 family transcriptional regulator [Campylobacter majalis]|uniref:Rrf2 family transcriptional regulator n=1 Tax=Campylobacter majalis TaxID=2790656 RepID=UPI003D6875A3